VEVFVVTYEINLLFCFFVKEIFSCIYNDEKAKTEKQEPKQRK